MNPNTMDIAAELERLRDEIAWTDPEDFEDAAPEFCDRLQSAADALYLLFKGGEAG